MCSEPGSPFTHTAELARHYLMGLSDQPRSWKPFTKPNNQSWRFLLDSTRNTTSPSERVVAEQAEEDGTGRTSCRTQGFGTATKKGVNRMNNGSSLQNGPGLPPPSWRFYPTRESDFFKHFFSPDVLHSKVQYNRLPCSCQLCNETCLCDQGWNKRPIRPIRTKMVAWQGHSRLGRETSKNT